MSAAKGEAATATAAAGGADAVLPEGWEMVIGLEVHAELQTNTKLFCGCPNAFGGEPNTHVCPVCLGLPGSLPVLNRGAVELAMALGRALGCTVEPAVFARKNYFYPDMPKDYQVSQYDLPTNVDGSLELPSGKPVGVERAHIEEDTGKSTHVGGGGRIHDATETLVDYNRAGVPLVEIVSRPDLASAEEARAYAAGLRAVLVATGASDARMEEGSMRVDANVSVRKVGDPLGTRCEIKNLNSLRSLGRAIDYEARRQVDLIEAGDEVSQETRHWNEDDGRTHTLRSKEEAYDYRYFPEPDLVPLAPSDGWVAEVDAALPELPAARRHRLASAAGVEPAEVALLVERDRDELAHAALAAGADAKVLLTRLEHDVPAEGDVAFDGAALAKLVGMEKGGELTATQAKQVLAEMVEAGGDPAAIAEAKGFEAMDTSELEAMVDEVIAANPDDWQQFLDADDKAAGKLTGFFVGQVMKASRGQADGKAVTQLLQAKRAAG